MEMSPVLRDVERFERASAFLVENIEALDQAKIVAHLGIGSGAPPAVEIFDECGPADCGEHRVSSPEAHRFRRVSRDQRESLRRRSDPFFNEARVETYDLSRVVDRRPGAFKDRARLGGKDPHTNPRQDVERGAVQPFDLLVRRDGKGRIGVGDLLKPCARRRALRTGRATGRGCARGSGVAFSVVRS